MNPQAAWEDIERLYYEALELPIFERKALLARVDPALREEVESLLEADSSTGLSSCCMASTRSEKDGISHF